ncbi:DNA-directed RNA polymerase subunit delta [Metabacillus herbersteinensis]|uniref:Probable DNA-directed RNA polymerase subunit delta n=1 Tax=Metabacillus herbersteinensis TaxID=283816 RepID=A0ABV6GFJ9_9BACI
MGLKQYSKEQIKELAMVEVAYEIFTEKKKPIIFKDLVNDISKILGLSKEQVANKISQFYTDVNIDGRFICVGENTWGLRIWYPYDQIEEEVVPVAKPKKKKSKKVVEEDLDLNGFDDVEEDDLDYDDHDDLDDDDDDLTDDLDDDDDDDDLDDDDIEDLDDDLLDDDDEEEDEEK